MSQSSTTWIRFGIAGMILSFGANMVLADPLPDPVAIVCMTGFLASFLVLLAGTVRALRAKGGAS